jgi:hypothetical protein
VLERAHRVLVVLVLLDDRAIRSDRFVDASEVSSVRLGDLGFERALLRAARLLETRFERGDEGWPLLRGGCSRFELGHRTFTRGAELECALRVTERRSLVLQVVPGDGDELLDDGELLLVAFRVGEEHLVERGQSRPLLFLFVEGNERARRTLVVRAHREHALVGSERALGLAQLLLVYVSGAEGELHLRRGIACSVGCAREHLGQAFPIVRLREERREPLVVARAEVAVS